MNAKDKIRLLDMLDAANDAQSFVAGRDQTALYSDKMFAYALVRAIEIIGEAAAQVTQLTRKQLPQIPWKVIIGMRNKVIHDYGSIDLEVVWETAIVYIPQLILQLETILHEEK